MQWVLTHIHLSELHKSPRLFVMNTSNRLPQGSNVFPHTRQPPPPCRIAVPIYGVDNRRPKTIGGDIW